MKTMWLLTKNILIMLQKYFKNNKENDSILVEKPYNCQLSLFY